MAGMGSPLLLAMISSQDAKVESAMALGRGKVAFEGDKVDCNASSDGEVVGEALLHG